MLLPDGTIKVMDFGIARFNRETNKTISEKPLVPYITLAPNKHAGK